MNALTINGISRNEVYLNKPHVKAAPKSNEKCICTSRAIEASVRALKATARRIPSNAFLLLPVAPRKAGINGS
jgi:hypothetical protein